MNDFAGKKVVLVVDNPTRDLPGIVLLGAYLSNSGIKCYLLSMNVIYNTGAEEIWRICPDFILLNYMRANNQELIKSLTDMNIPVGVLDTEGGVLASLESYKQTYVRDIDLVHKIKVYFSWGKILGNYLVKENLLKPNQLKITGSPRFDFYSKLLHGAAKWETREYFKNDNPIVLINSNFPIANPKFQSKEEEKNMLLKTFNMSMQEVESIIASQQNGLDSFIQITLALANHFPNINFLYRPHPFENENIYIDSFLDKSNILMSKEGPVLNQIEKSICIIHRSCSTAIEAQLIGKPAFSVKWVPCYNEQPLSEAVSIWVDDYSMLINQLNLLLSGHFVMPEKVISTLSIIGNDWFGGFDGLAHQRVGNAISEILAEENKIDTKEKLVKQYRSTVKSSFTKRTKGIAYLILNIQFNWSLKKYLKGIKQEKSDLYQLSLKERVSWFLILFFNWNRRKVLFGTNGWVNMQNRIWFQSAKYFDEKVVRKIIEGIVIKMPSFTCLNVRKSSSQLDYEIGIGNGVSIIIEKKIE